MFCMRISLSSARWPASCADHAWSRSMEIACGTPSPRKDRNKRHLRTDHPTAEDRCANWTDERLLRLHEKMDDDIVNGVFDSEECDTIAAEIFSTHEEKWERAVYRFSAVEAIIHEHFIKKETRDDA